MLCRVKLFCCDIDKVQISSGLTSHCVQFIVAASCKVRSSLFVALRQRPFYIVLIGLIIVNKHPARYADTEVAHATNKSIFIFNFHCLTKFIQLLKCKMSAIKTSVSTLDFSPFTSRHIKTSTHKMQYSKRKIKEKIYSCLQA